MSVDRSSRARASRVVGGRRLSGRTIAPPDKSITHRALLLAALGEGTTRIAPLSLGADNRSTAAALAGLGVRVELDEAHGEARVTGVGGPRGLVQPSAAIDCGNSGTTMRLLSGVLGASSLEVTLTGDDSLCSRPMDRLSPLVQMGARIDGERRAGRLYPPLTVKGGALSGGTFRLPIASAQVKSALLLAGLWADGTTTVIEPERSRDHTERMLARLGAPIRVSEDGAISVQRLSAPWRARELEVAPDPSSAAFLLAAALLTGSETVEVTSSVNPTRSGFLEALAAFGAEVERRPLPDCGGEPMASISVRAKEGLRAATIAGATTLRAIDEVPVLAAVAAFATGTTEIRDAGELRVKESDRLAGTAALLRAFGAEVEERADGLLIHGDPRRLHAAEVDGGADHRLAMTAIVLGLSVGGCTVVRGAEIMDVSFPGFEAELERLGAEVEKIGGADLESEVR